MQPGAYVDRLRVTDDRTPAIMPAFSRLDRGLAFLSASG